MNGRIQRVGAIEREDHVLGPLGANPLREHPARFLDEPLRRDGFVVHAATDWRANLAQEVLDGAVDRLGLGPTRGRVIEVNAFTGHGIRYFRQRIPPSILVHRQFDDDARASSRRAIDQRMASQ